ncbi:repetitive proline-rich cell wall protein 1-like [Prunus avium]|uniref:Repetitive proline-rich cell wall protein 1-like n=1 Tax=Prunus avium TaxID=42229 RepID=A0A6P5RU39_PRUAV|nr:repetitive proline-rich cell wall protein 1-like [Prunus avium]
MQTRLAFQGAVLGLWFCLFAVSFCYSSAETVEVAGEQVLLDKAFSELQTEAAELNEEGKFAVLPPKPFFKKPPVHKIPIVKKPFPPKPSFKKPPLHKIPTVKKPFPPPVPIFKIPPFKKPGHPPVLVAERKLLDSGYNYPVYPTAPIPPHK